MAVLLRSGLRFVSGTVGLWLAVLVDGHAWDDVGMAMERP